MSYLRAFLACAMAVFHLTNTMGSSSLSTFSLDLIKIYLRRIQNFCIRKLASELCFVISSSSYKKLIFSRTCTNVTTSLIMGYHSKQPKAKLMDSVRALIWLKVSNLANAHEKGIDVTILHYLYPKIYFVQVFMCSLSLSVLCNQNSNYCA